LELWIAFEVLSNKGQYTGVVQGIPRDAHGPTTIYINKLYNLFTMSDFQQVFFTPLHESFETAIKAITKLHGQPQSLQGKGIQVIQGISCDATQIHTSAISNVILPDELGMTQFKMTFQMDKDGVDKYPLSFRSLSNNKEKERLDHVMYSVVYPKIRMDIVTFETMIQHLLHKIHDVCDVYDVRDVWEPSRTAAPSSQRMRFLCEALYAYVFSSKSSNDALLAYALYHHIGANDIQYDDLKSNCLFTRLIYKAIEAFNLSPEYLRYMGSLGMMADTIFCTMREEFQPGVAHEL